LIVYQKQKRDFLADVHGQDIEALILAAMKHQTGHGVGVGEIRSWKESLTAVAKVLYDPGIPEDAGVAVEYSIPQTAKRIDVIVSGRDEEGRDNAVVVELKQWSWARKTDKDAIVVTQLGKGEREVSHPSYQAWSYVSLLNAFNEEVHTGGIVLQPCAYLHNYQRDGVLDDPFYATHLEAAPLFFAGEAERHDLRGFLRARVRSGDRGETISRIEKGKIRPSKMLADSIAGMLDGNREFVLIDDQKVVYERALELAHAAQLGGPKQVLIVEGGPGTGKTVLAVNLLSALTKRGIGARYVSKNAAPREVYQRKLAGTRSTRLIKNLFSGSGAYQSAKADDWGTLIVDEAHRLNEKSGLYGVDGEHQAKELIRASRSTVFFVDDDQRVTLKDIGERAALREWAIAEGAEVSDAKLESQFRCSGSDGYLAWLDNTLQIRDTANTRLEAPEFDFRVFDSPSALHDAITERNAADNKARVVAGYCWKWPSKKDPQRYDIEMPEHGYQRRWNLRKDGNLWIVADGSVDEVGCIHTCQGLEVDIIGVIVGPDLVVRDGKVFTVPERRASSDQSLKGYKKLAKADSEGARRIADRIVKNTYRTLMTRGMKGCWVYCTDVETREWFRLRSVGPEEGVHADA
jgi:DUF2075 family protein